MSSRVAFPFLTLGDQAVRPGFWQIAIDDGVPSPAGDYLPDWDYASRIRLSRAIVLDRAIAASDLGISAESLSLDVGLRVGTGQGRLPRIIIHRETTRLEPETDSVAFDIEIAGKDLSSVLDLHVEIVLGTPPETADDLSPRRQRDRLWQETHRLRLEGEEPRFPIEVADFRTLLGDTVAASSPWYLHWSPDDWSSDFHGSMRLYLNQGCPEVIERIQSADRETLRALMADVMGQVCERYVLDEEAQGQCEAWDPGSLGSQARGWLQMAWRGKDEAFIRSQLEHRPGAFHAAFLALAEQKGEEQ